MSLTSITLTGTLKKNAEQKHTANGTPIISVMMNVARYDGRTKEEKQYPVKVNMWGETFADMVEKLTEGTRIIATGRLQIDQFNDRNGKMIKLLCIEATRVQLLSELQGGSSSMRIDSNPYDASIEESAPSGSETDAYSDQEVPF